MNKLSPACFLVGRLGFTKVAEVHEGDALGFVILAKDGVQIMYQTYDSVKKDTPAILDHMDMTASRSALYIKISDIDWIEKHLDGVDIIFPKRKTFYGATEISVREPAGHITFAAFSDAQAEESNY
ncbi:MAG: hypothetical protein R3A45_06305 [Bdellovibrionota bacterium]